MKRTASQQVHRLVRRLLPTPEKRKRRDEFRSLCPSISAPNVASWRTVPSKGVMGHVVQHGHLRLDLNISAGIRPFSVLVRPEVSLGDGDVATGTTGTLDSDAAAARDWKQEKEQRRRRTRRRKKESFNQQQSVTAPSVLANSTISCDEGTDAGQLSIHTVRRKLIDANSDISSPNSAAKESPTHRYSRPKSPAALDPAVSAILNDLKRLTLQINPRYQDQNGIQDANTVPREIPVGSSSVSMGTSLPVLPTVPALPDDGRSSVNRSRRVVSQFIPMWLRREPTWKVAVLEHLNLPTHLSTSMATSSRRGGSGATTGTSMQGSFSSILPSNFYPDSIPSFAEILKQGPPKSLHRALDGLVQAGLADAGTTERYRATNRMRVQQQDLLVEIADRKVSIERHQRLYDQMAEELVDIKARIETLTSTSSEVEQSVDSNDFMVDRASSLRVDYGVPSEANGNDSYKKQLANLIKMRGEKTHNMSRHRHTMDTHVTKLKHLRTEQPEPPLTEEEYARIQLAAASAREDITRVFASHVRDRNSQMLEQYQALENKTDLTRPAGWFLHARLDKRKIVFHGGGTNSGKTYAALERLKQAKKGMYLGPLRLLAVEIYEKLTADGIYCNLFTGQERREIPFATHGAATVEMAGLMEEYEVIVIDEIQMLGDWERGFAWTRALLGSRCKEIHVCGGMEASKIVKRIADACGDQFELRTYERFSELQIANDSLADMPDQLGSYKHVRPGDCVVAFSRNDIFAIKREIESTTDFKCCVVYGTLPPATRSEQARRFNDPNSGYDVLVASDAIGMGLNLSIRRIIFNSIYKNDGNGIVRLGHSAMKQISGRAGRRNSPFPIGEVTTRDPRDMEYLRQCLLTDVKPIEKAGLLPTTAHIQTFSDTLEQYGLGHGTKNLHDLLLQFNDMASVKSDYFVCKQGAMVKIARAIARLDLSIADKYLLCQCPVSERDSSSMDVLKRFATKLAAKEVAGLTRSMIPKAPKSFDDLARLCSLFSELELFMWLNTKFPPGNVMEQQTAQSLKEQAISMITQGLSMTDKLKLKHCYITRDRSLRQKWTSSQSKQTELFDEDEEDWNEGIADI